MWKMRQQPRTSGGPFIDACIWIDNWLWERKVAALNLCGADISYALLILSSSVLQLVSRPEYLGKGQNLSRDGNTTISPEYVISGVLLATPWDNKQYALKAFMASGAEGNFLMDHRLAR